MLLEHAHYTLVHSQLPFGLNTKHIPRYLITYLTVSIESEPGWYGYESF